MSTQTVHLTRSERGQVVRTTHRLLTAERREFRSSSNPNVSYTARVELDGKTFCDCRGWTIKKQWQPRQCKHTHALIGDRPTRSDGEYLYVVRGNANQG